MSGHTKIKVFTGGCFALWMTHAFFKFGWAGLLLPPICMALAIPIVRLLGRWEDEP